MSGGTAAAATTATVAASASAAAAGAAATAGAVAGTAGVAAAAGGIAASTGAGLSTLAELGMGASLLSAGVGAYGAIQQGAATSAANKYNAQIASNNATIAAQNASYAGAAGIAQGEQAGLQNRAKLGGIIANQAASGVDVGSGSSLDVRSSARELGELNAITIRSNAARQAYGYQVQGANDTAESQLDTFQASNASTAGDIGAGSSILGGAGSAATNYAKFMQSGG